MLNRTSPEARFWHYAFPEPMSGCWLWTGHVNKGYGYLRTGGRKKTAAYRFSYELHKGPISLGSDIDHVCRNTFCVNPDHLEEVSHRENLLRGNTFAAANSAKTHCKRGHPFASSDVRRDGRRQCLECARIYDRKRYSVQKRGGYYIRKRREIG